MTFRLLENVHETTTSTSSPYTLLGAVADKYPLSRQMSNGDDTVLIISDGVDIEIGRYVYNNTSGQQITIAEIYHSSNGGSPVTWGAGTRNVISGLPASFAEPLFTQQSAFTTLTFSSVADASQGSAQDWAHGLGSDDVDFGFSWKTSTGGLVLNGVGVQALAASGYYRFSGIHPGSVTDPNESTDTPGAGNIRFNVYNGTGSVTDIVVKVWARKRV